MSALVSIRLDEDLFRVMTTIAGNLHVSKTEYIRRAIAEMNKKIEEQNNVKRLQQASFLVRDESMKVNAEFEAIEDDPTD